MGDDDFIRVEGKVPRSDKAGKEIRPDSLGSGGARRSDGTLSAMAYDLRPLSDEGSEPSSGASTPGPGIPPWMVEFFLNEVVVPAARASYPHLKKWLIESAGPVAREKWQGLRTSRRDTREQSKGGDRSTALPKLRSNEQAERAEQVGLAVVQPQIKMSSSEWQKGFLAWTEAAAVEEALRRMLTNANIEDDDAALLELQRGVGILSPEQRSTIANRMLEAESSSLDEELFAKLVKVFGEGRAVGGQYAPVQLEQAAPGTELPDLGN